MRPTADLFRRGPRGDRGPSASRALSDPTTTPTTTMSRKRFAAVAAISALVAAAAVVVVPAVVAAAAPPTTTLAVNSTAWGGPDATPGDGICETATGNGVCTLRAAITEANALNGQPGEVEVTVSPSIGPGTKMTGTPNVQADKMLAITNCERSNHFVTNLDTCGAYFHVTSPMTIDLGHRLQVDGAANDNNEAAAFYLNAPDIQVLNADNVMSSGASFVVGPNANRVTIDGDTAGGFATIDTPTWNPERFVVFREGASNITVRNYQISGYYNSANDGGLFVFDSLAPYAPMNNIVIDRIQALYSSGSTCNGSDGTGCRTRLTNFWRATSASGVSQAWTNNTINGLTFTNMLVQNMTDQYAFQFGNPGDTGGTNSAAISNLTIENNVFVNNRGYNTNQNHAFVTLPYANKLTGTNSISNNVFSRASSGQTHAISYYGNGGGATNSTTPSGLTIANNHFNGYTGGATIRSERAGLVTVTGNTFGPATGSQAAPGIVEEYTDSASVMHNTHHSPNASTNQSIRTWAPSGPAQVLAGPVPGDAAAMSDPREGALPTCTVTAPVTKITATDNSTKAPGEPVTLQAYWTASRTAEVYLGQVEHVTGDSATVAVQLPVGPVPLPDGTTATVVNATSGAASGYLRLQTHVEGLAQLESSQYSRIVAVSGTCRPALTLNQANGMADPTYGRDLHFTLSSSMPLDPGTVTVADIAVTATPVSQTIDANRLNPRVVSVTPVPGSDDMEFDVIVRVDDSAKVQVALAANTVATPAGLTNQNPATSTDDAITFLNPLRVSPPNFTLVTGEPNGKQFTISVASGAPLPQADLMFTAVVTQPAGTPTMSLSTTGPILRSGDTSADPVTVTAAAGDVVANTETTIAMTVDSPDTNYDGLVVPPVTPYLFSTDPTIHITKTAYTDVTDASSADQIEMTGTPAPSGTRLMDRQAVCFVYTVSNVSHDDWETSLTDVTVTDSDTRLGDDGLIGTIPALNVGQSVKLYVCTSLLPIDTTVRTGAGE